jgi:putative flippase GtrA
MAGAPIKVGKAVWHLLPAPVRRKLRTEPGKRFMRFVPVSLAALGSSQLSLALLVGVIGMSAGTAAFIASIVGAGVSYLLSRWAWERKGRPDLLRETLPFWVVSVAAWTFLSFISHEASIWSRSVGHSHWQHVAVINGAYFLANCVTFVARFAIFHYVLFANREGRLPGQQTRTAAPASHNGSAPQHGAVSPSGTVPPNGTAAPNGAVSPNGTVTPNGSAPHAAPSPANGHGQSAKLEMVGHQPAEPRAHR